MKINDSFQIFLRFVGWTTQLLNVLDLKQTVLTYLRPIEKPISNYGATVEMFTGSEQLSKQANIEYIHITLDVGVAIKKFYVQRNHPQRADVGLIQLKLQK